MIPSKVDAPTTADRHKTLTNQVSGVLKVQGFIRFRVQDSRLRIQGLGFRICIRRGPH